MIFYSKCWDLCWPLMVQELEVFEVSTPCSLDLLLLPPSFLIFSLSSGSSSCIFMFICSLTPGNDSVGQCDLGGAQFAVLKELLAGREVGLFSLLPSGCMPQPSSWLRPELLANSCLEGTTLLRFNI